MPAKYEYDLAGARAAGLSELDIAQYLAGKAGYQLDEALAAGLTPEDVVGYLAEQPAVPEASIADRAVDTAIDASKGVIGLGQGVVGIGSMVTGGKLVEGMRALGYDPEEAKRTLSEGYSPERQEENRAVADAKGFGGTLKALVQNPAVAVGSAVESAPLMLGSMGAARVMAGRAAIAAEEAAIANGVTDAAEVAKLVAGASDKAATLWASIAEGAQTAGASFESLSQQGADIGKNYVASVLSGAGTAAIGRLAGGVGKAFGLGDVEAGVGGSGGVLAKILKGGVQEGVLEEAPQSYQEQVWQNYALDRPLAEGAGEAAAHGAVAGALMGAPFAATAKPKLSDITSADTIEDAGKAALEVVDDELESDKRQLRALGVSDEESVADLPGAGTGQMLDDAGAELFGARALLGLQARNARPDPLAGTGEMPQAGPTIDDLVYEGMGIDAAAAEPETRAARAQIDARTATLQRLEQIRRNRRHQDLDEAFTVGQATADLERQGNVLTDEAAGDARFNREWAQAEVAMRETNKSDRPAIDTPSAGRATSDYRSAMLDMEAAKGLEQGPTIFEQAELDDFEKKSEMYRKAKALDIPAQTYPKQGIPIDREGVRLQRAATAIRNAPEYTPEVPASKKTLPERLAAAVGKPEEIDTIQKMGVVEPEAQVERIVSDALQPADVAVAAAKKGKSEMAKKALAIAEERGAKLKAADGELVDALVDEELRPAEEAVAAIEQKAEQPRSLPPMGYVTAKKQPGKGFKLFFVGTRNEVYPGEMFNSAKQARDFHAANLAKEGKDAKPQAPAPQRDTEADTPVQPGRDEGVVAPDADAGAGAAAGNRLPEISKGDVIKVSLGGRVWNEPVLFVAKDMYGPGQNGYLVDVFGEKYIKPEQVEAVKTKKTGAVVKVDAAPQAARPRTAPTSEPTPEKTDSAAPSTPGADYSAIPEDLFIEVQVAVDGNSDVSGRNARQTIKEYDTIIGSLDALLNCVKGGR